MFDCRMKYDPETLVHVQTSDIDLKNIVHEEIQTILLPIILYFRSGNKIQIFFF